MQQGRYKLRSSCRRSEQGVAEAGTQFVSWEGFLDQGSIPEPEMASIHLIAVMGLTSWF